MKKLLTVIVDRISRSMTRSVVINGSKRSSAIVCTFLITSSAEFSGYCLFDIRKCKNLKIKCITSKYIII